MATADEVYDSLCALAQEFIDKMEREASTMSQDQFIELQRKINKIHKFMEDFSKNFRTK